MSSKICVVGSSNTDMVVNVSHLPKPGETVLGGKFKSAGGGKGANQAVAAARAGASVSFIAKVGNDLYGNESIKAFKKDNIDTSSVIVDNNSSSGVALIFVAQDGENCISVASGANMELTPEDVQNASEKIENSDIILMQLETPLNSIEMACKIAKEKHKKIILNPAPATKLSDELLSKISIITPNETEAFLLTGIEITDIQSASESADILLAKGIDIVLITMGSKGAFLATQEIKKVIEPFLVKPVDTVAAGDTFNGALAVAIGEGKSIIDAVRFANAAAAIAVSRHGAQDSAPTRLEIETFLSANN